MRVGKESRGGEREGGEVGKESRGRERGGESGKGE